MDPRHFRTGQLWQRTGAVLLCALSGGLVQPWRKEMIPGLLLAASCVAAFLFVTMSFPSLYKRWMNFAEWLSLWVTRVMFSLIYLLAILCLQFLRYKDRLRLRSLDGHKSLWIDRQQPMDTFEELRRMG